MASKSVQGFKQAHECDREKHDRRQTHKPRTLRRNAKKAKSLALQNR